MPDDTDITQWEITCRRPDPMAIPDGNYIYDPVECQWIPVTEENVHEVLRLGEFYTFRHVPREAR